MKDQNIDEKVKKEEDLLAGILKLIEGFGYINPEEIPNIDLYMDQVTTFMDESLQSSKRFEEDKVLTKTMINNYTKNKLLPPSVKKKYSKEHIIFLIFIYYFKNILSINDIQKILHPFANKFYDKESGINLLDIYKEVLVYEEAESKDIIKDIIKKYNLSQNAFVDLKEGEDKDYLTQFLFICLLNIDIYIKKGIIEHIIDTTFSKFNENTEASNGDKKNKEKKDKEKEK